MLTNEDSWQCENFVQGSIIEDHSTSQKILDTLNTLLNQLPSEKKNNKDQLQAIIDQVDNINQTSSLRFCNILNEILYLEIVRDQDKQQLYLNRLQLSQRGSDENFVRKRKLIALNETIKSSERKKHQNDRFKEFYELEVNPNDNYYLCLKINRLFGEQIQSRINLSNLSQSSIQRGSSLYKPSEKLGSYIPKSCSRIITTDLYICKLEDEEEEQELNFFKVQKPLTSLYINQVFWHPSHPSAIVCLSATQSQLQILNIQPQTTKEQHLFIFDIKESLLNPVFEINFNKHVEGEDIIQVYIPKIKTSPDLQDCSIFIMNSYGDLYYIFPFLIQDQLIEKETHACIQELLIKPKPSQINTNQAFETPRSDIRSENFIKIPQTIFNERDQIQLKKISILSKSEAKYSDYFYFEKINSQYSNSFIRLRRDIQNGNIFVSLIASFDQLLTLEKQHTQKPKKTDFYEILFSQIQQPNLLTKIKTLTALPNLLDQESKMIINQAEKCLLSQYPKNIKPSLTLQGFSQCYKTTNSFKKYQYVYTFFYLDQLIIIDLNNFLNFETNLKHDAILNIEIQQIKLEQETGQGQQQFRNSFPIQEIISIGNQFPSNMICTYFKDEKVNTMTFNLSQFIDFISETENSLQLNQEQPPNQDCQLAKKRLGKIKDQLLQKKKELDQLVESTPNFDQKCESLIDSINKIVSNDISREFITIQQKSNDMNLLVQENAEIMDGYIEKKNKITNLGETIQDNNKIIIQKLKQVESRTFTDWRKQDQLKNEQQSNDQLINELKNYQTYLKGVEDDLNYQKDYFAQSLTEKDDEELERINRIFVEQRQKLQDIMRLEMKKLEL